MIPSLETSPASSHPPPPSANPSTLSFASPRQLAAEFSGLHRSSSFASSRGALSHHGGPAAPRAPSAFGGSAGRGSATVATTAAGPGGFKKRRTPPLVVEPPAELEARLKAAFVAYAMHGSRPNSVYITFPKFFRLLLDSGALVRRRAGSPPPPLLVRAGSPAERLTRPRPAATTLRSSSRRRRSTWSTTSSRKCSGCARASSRGDSRHMPEQAAQTHFYGEHPPQLFNSLVRGEKCTRTGPTMGLHSGEAQKRMQPALSAKSGGREQRSKRTPRLTAAPRGGAGTRREFVDALQRLARLLNEMSAPIDAANEVMGECLHNRAARP